MNTKGSALLSAVVLGAMFLAPVVPTLCESRRLPPPEPAAIVVPEKIETGELVVARAAAEAGGYAWTLIPNRQFMAGDGGRQIAFTSGKRAGKIIVVLATAAGNVPSIQQATVTVADEDPQPDPEPEPKPEPKPKPDPKPDPKPEPKPVPAELWCIVVEETADRSPEHAAVYASPKVRALFDSKRFRLLDKDSTPSADMLPYVERAKKQTLPVMFLASASGAVYFEGAPPKTVAEMVALVESKKAGK